MSEQRKPTNGDGAQLLGTASGGATDPEEAENQPNRSAKAELFDRAMLAAGSKRPVGKARA